MTFEKSVSNTFFDAILFATKAHHGQVRKYTGEPYVVHCLEVAKQVSHLGSVTMITALLHDTIEDTDVTYEDIENNFGTLIARNVLELTDPLLSAGNRAFRKNIVCEKMAKASIDAKSVKCADILDNLPSIQEHDPKFYKVFLEEKRTLIPFLEGADQMLLDEVTKYEANN